MWPGNTQMASLGRQVTQKEAKWVNNDMARDNVQCVVEVTVLAHGGVKMMMLMMTPVDDEWR